MTEVENRETYTAMSNYELCSLYVDYYEWMVHPLYSKDKTDYVKSKYKEKCEEILLEIARRHKSEV